MIFLISSAILAHYQLGFSNGGPASIISPVIILHHRLQSRHISGIRVSSAQVLTSFTPSLKEHLRWPSQIEMGLLMALFCLRLHGLPQSLCHYFLRSLSHAPMVNACRHFHHVSHNRNFVRLPCRCMMTVISPHIDINAAGLRALCYRQ